MAVWKLLCPLRSDTAAGLRMSQILCRLIPQRNWDRKGQARVVFARHFPGEETLNMEPLGREIVEEQTFWLEEVTKGGGRSRWLRVPASS